MNQPLVTIIVTCYNQKGSILKTLASVKQQTYFNWECIVVDDGSTDGSAGEIQAFIAKNNCFRYIYQDNSGVSKARNLGFRKAKGDFINFLDGDDTFLPEKLNQQIKVFNKQPEISVCICDHQYFNETKETYAHYKFESLKQKPLKQLLYGWGNGVAFPPHAALYKRDIWSQNEKPFPEDYPYRCEDWVFNVLVALKGINYYWLDIVLCNYHRTGSNYTNDRSNLTQSGIKAAFYLKSFIPDNEKETFIDHTLEIKLKNYLKNHRRQILESSKNWRVANNISRTILKFFNSLKN